MDYERQVTFQVPLGFDHFINLVVATFSQLTDLI